jgi:hypothetical protein
MTQEDEGLTPRPHAMAFSIPNSLNLSTVVSMKVLLNPNPQGEIRRTL